MLRTIFFHTLIALGALWLSVRFVPGVNFYGSTEIFIFCGFILGLLNAFVKPVLKTITFPLRILTLGLFNFVLSITILWLLDVIFPELIISGIWPLILSSLIISVLIKIFYPK